MKHLTLLSAACLMSAVAFSAVAQDADNSFNGNMRQNARQRGGRANRMGGENGGMRAFSIDRMLGGLSARYEAEMKIKEKFSAEYAAIEKEAAALEAKLQELAKKAEVTLPETQEARSRKLAEFKTKNAKELEEITAQFKTDFRGAMESLRALMEKEGITMQGMMGGMRGGFGGARGGEGAENAPKAPARDNSMGRTRAMLKEKYPQEYEAMMELRKTDPQAAQKKQVELIKKMIEEKKQNAAPAVEK